MLIDVNAYVGHWPFKRLADNNCDGLLKKMNLYGVDLSVVTNLNGIFYKNTQSANEELVAEIRSKKIFGNRFLPFAIINPVYGGWKYDFLTCVKQFGMKGVRVFPNYHDYAIDEPALIELVKMARDHDVAIALTMRMVDSRQRSWMDLPVEWGLKDYLPLLKTVPDARYLLLNLSTGLTLSPEEDALLKNGHVLFDTSGRNISDFGDFYKRFGKTRVACGTHFPVFDYLTGLLRIESLRATEADEADKDLFRYRNARSFLKV
jgi:predicted TIM-barrel fold metal-dependent hydrolase